jgi:hypothetical protein
MVKRIPAELRAYFQAMGRKGGRIGGKRSLETMTRAERVARARAASKAAAKARSAAAVARRAKPAKAKD